jgi:hypothetical protein
VTQTGYGFIAFWGRRSRAQLSGTEVARQIACRGLESETALEFALPGAIELPKPHRY